MAANLVLSGGPLHDFDATTSAIVSTLAEVGIESTVFENPRTAFQALSENPTAWDLVTVNTLRWQITTERHAHLADEWSFALRDDEAEALVAFVRAGGGLLACHSAVISFDADPRWAECIGATWNWERSSHPPLGEARIVPTPAGADHPLTHGLQEYSTVDEVYGFLDQADDIVPLLTSAHGGRDHPVLWARSVGSGRVVTDLTGHDAAAVNHPVHREILWRAGRWLTEGSPGPGGGHR